MTRVLITGGNGYVGRALTRKLSPHHEVTVVDCLRHGMNRFEPQEMNGFRFEKTDIRDYEALAGVFEDVRPELVFHTAALHFIPECESHPDEAISINTLGTANVCRACPQGAGLVFISTAAVYGPEDTAHLEDESPIAPMDVYGWSKLHAEHYVRYFAAKKDLRAAIVRLFNVIGPGETNPHILPAIIAQLQRGQHELHLGNCYPKRDYIDVSDVADGLMAVGFGLDDEPGVDVVNLGTGKSYSVYEIVDKLSAVLGERLSITTEEARLRAVDRPMLMAGTEKMRRRYNWGAQMTLDDSLHNLWKDPDIPAELLRKS